MRWNACKGKRGQAEHIFSDALPGIGIIALGMIILSIIHGSSSDVLQSTIDGQILDSYVERQLVQYLESSIDFHGEQKEVWQVFVDPNVDIKSPLELNGAFGDKGILSGDSAVVADYASHVFTPLFEPAPWDLIARYDDLPYPVMVQHSQFYPDDCTRFNGIAGTVHLVIPDKRKITIELHYCKKL